MSRPRLAFLRVAQETNAHSPVRSTLADFERTHWFEGEALLRRCQPDGVEVPGFLKNAELSGLVRAVRDVAGGRIALVPLFSAWAIPGGPLAADALEALRARVREALTRAGPVDGVFISLHGAMNAEGEDDPEARFLEEIRAVVGPEVPIAITLDLHAQLTRRLVEQVDILSAYRTNPHRDHARTGYRAGAMLAKRLLGLARPVLAWRTLPLVLGGGTTIDVAPTMRPLFRHMTRMERHPKVLDASLLTCHLWARDPELGWAAVVMTDGEVDLAEALAEDLADRAWGVRHAQPPTFPDPEQAIARVRRARLRRGLGTVCMCDASDIVGAGAAGENTRLLRALIEQAPDLVSYVPLRDPHTLDAIADRPDGAVVDVVLGGRLDPENPPLPLRATILRRAAHPVFGRMAVLVHHGVHVVLTEGQPLAMKPAFFTHVGLSPWAADVVVVKSLFPFRLYFLLHNRQTLYVRTEGATDLDRVRTLRFDHPVHPLHAVADWRPTDRRRRGVADAPREAVPVPKGPRYWLSRVRRRR